jgi:hypothetical protein
MPLLFQGAHQILVPFDGLKRKGIFPTAAIKPLPIDMIFNLDWFGKDIHNKMTFIR